MGAPVFIDGLMLLCCSHRTGLATTRMGYNELRPHPCFVSSTSACLFLKFSVMLRHRKVLASYSCPNLDLQPVEPWAKWTFFYIYSSKGWRQSNYCIIDSVDQGFRMCGCFVSGSVMRVQREWREPEGLLSPEGTMGDMTSTDNRWLPLFSMWPFP